MTHLSFFRRFVCMAWFGVGVAVSALAQNIVPTVVNDTNRTGSLPFSSSIGTEIEHVDAASGALEIAIPLFTIPGRHLDSRVVLYYTSNVYGTNILYDAEGAITTYEWARLDHSGWVDNTPYISSNVFFVPCQVPGHLPDSAAYQNYIYWDDHHGQHPMATQFALRPGASCQNPTDVGPDLTADGMLGAAQDKVLLADGTSFSQTFNLTTTDSNGNSISLVNPYPSSGSVASLADTLGKNSYTTAIDHDANNIPTTTTYSVYDSNGVSQQYVVKWVALPVSTNFGIAAQEDNASTYQPQPVEIAISEIDFPNGQKYVFKYEPGYALVNEIDLPSGAVIQYTYANYIDNSDLYNNGTRRYVTTRTEIVDGVSSTWQINIPNNQGNAVSTKTATVTYPNSAATQTSNNQSVFTSHDGVVSDVKIYAGPATGTPLREYAIEYDSDASPLEDSCYTQYALGEVPLAQVVGIRPTKVTTTLENGISSVKRYIYETFSYSYHSQHCNTPQNASNFVTSRGNVTEIDEYDWSTGSNPGNLLRKITKTYWHNTASNAAQYLSANIVDKVASTSVYDGSSNLLSQTSYIYDDYSPGDGGGIVSTSNAPGHDTNYSSSFTIRGNLTHLNRWINTYNSWATTVYGYDDLGNVVSTRDPRGHSTAWSYSDNWADVPPNCQPSGNSFAYPTLVTNALNHQTRIAYDPCTGLEKTIADPNDLANGRQGTHFDYDSVNRKTNVSLADGGLTSKTFVDSVPQSVATAVKQNLSGGWINSTTKFDGMGRVSQTQINSDPAGVDYVDTTYDPFGQITSISNPYRGTSDPSYGITSYIYDALGRKLIQCQPDNGNNSPCVADKSYLQWTYSGNTTSFRDEMGNVRQQTFDALGRLTAVVEPGNLHTDYGYDGFGNLVSVNQHGTSGEVARLRWFVYDSLSRLTAACNPESIATGQSCSSSGPWSDTYTYDANSNLTSKTDARGFTVNYSPSDSPIDALNRVTKKTSPSWSYSYGYDSGSNGIGRLTYASNNVNADEVFTYDPVGRIASQGSWLPSTGPQRAYVYAQYDLAGDLAQLTYPDGRVLNHARNGVGQVTQIYDLNTGFQYLQNATYWANGAAQGIWHGNGIATGHHINNRLQIDEIGEIRIAAKAPGGYAANLSVKHYCFGPAAPPLSSSIAACPTLASGNNGNIWQVQDSLNNSRTQTLTYDSVNRVTSFVRNDASLQQTYGYDSFGNLNQTSPGTLQTNLTFDGNNRIIGKGYDASGNLISYDNGVSTIALAYDAENNLVNYNGGAATYTYNANADRVRKDVGNNWTEYVQFSGHTLAERNSDGTWSDYIFANGQRIARADGYDIRIHLSGTNCSNCGSNPNMFAGVTSLTAANGYTIRSGDVLTWRQYQNGATTGGLFLYFTDQTNGNSARDTDGQLLDQDTTMNSWHTRIVDLSAYAGKTIQVLDPFQWTSAPSGNWDIYYGDITLVSTDGASIPLYSRSMMTLSTATNPTVINFSAVTEKVADTAPLTTTTYYHESQVGSTQLLTSGGGWPISSIIYYPYGVEVAATTDSNTYKFSGKERDTESGLDYFGARYYGSLMGRFVSPDWSAKTEPIPYAKLDNPQSLNLYSYVDNNPLSGIDPDGHAPIDCSGANVGGAGCQAIDHWNSDHGILSTESKAAITHSKLTADQQKSFTKAVETAAGRGGIDPNILVGMAQQESTLGANMNANGPARGLYGVQDPQMDQMNKMFKLDITRTDLLSLGEKSMTKVSTGVADYLGHYADLYSNRSDPRGIDIAIGIWRVGIGNARVALRNGTFWDYVSPKDRFKEKLSHYINAVEQYQ